MTSHTISSSYWRKKYESMSSKAKKLFLFEIIECVRFLYYIDIVKMHQIPLKHCNMLYMGFVVVCGFCFDGHIY